MKNQFCVTFLMSSIFLETALSVKTKSYVEKDNINVESKGQTRNVRNYLSGVSGKNERSYIGGMPINFDDIFYEDKNGNDYQRRGVYERKGYNFEFDAGNPDVHGEIRRPCQAYDTFCIRKFFAEHSNCKISGRAVPDPLYRAPGSNAQFASNNMSETQGSALYLGVNNGRIAEFYINKVTDNLVIAITFDNVTKFTGDLFLKYYLRGREPIVTRDAAGINFGVLTITVIIPQIDNLRLDRSEIYVYGDDPIFTFFFGPRVAASTDPEVLTMYARFYTNIPAEYQEEITYHGNFIVENYIQYNICDFGLNIL